MYYFISYMLFYVPECTHQKQSSVTDLAIAAKDGIFLFSIVTSLQLICDVMWTRVTGIVT